MAANNLVWNTGTHGVSIACQAIHYAHPVTIPPSTTLGLVMLYTSRSFNRNLCFWPNIWPHYSGHTDQPISRSITKPLWMRTTQDHFACMYGCLASSSCSLPHCSGRASRKVVYRRVLTSFATAVVCLPSSNNTKVAGCEPACISVAHTTVDR